MQSNVKIFRGQWGGSTLIGLVLGLCLGTLALIKWPLLEVSARALLIGEDSRLAVRETLDSGLGSVLPVLGRLMPYASDNSESSAIPASDRGDRKEDTPADEYLNADPLKALSEPRVMNLPDPVNRANKATPDIRHPVALVTDAGADSSNGDVRATRFASAEAYEAPDEALEQEFSGYETREVWQAFSSESAAQAFATVVSKALIIDVDTLRRSEHKFIPVVRCKGPEMCDALSAKIATLLAGSIDSGVNDEI